MTLLRRALWEMYFPWDVGKHILSRLIASFLSGLTSYLVPRRKKALISENFRASLDPRYLDYGEHLRIENPGFKFTFRYDTSL